MRRAFYLIEFYSKPMRQWQQTAWLRAYETDYAIAKMTLLSKRAAHPDAEYRLVRFVLYREDIDV